MFDRLRYRRQDERVFLFAFDLLELDGRDLRREPLEMLKRTLAVVLRVKRGAGIQFNDHCDDLPADIVFRHACKLGFEGHREQAAWLALSVRAVAGLAEDEEPERTRSEARGGRGLGPRPMEKDYLTLKRASASRPSGQWNEDDFDALCNGEVVGRIFKSNAAPVGEPWMWTLIFPHHEARTPTHGYAATREAAMAGFAKSWRRG